MHYLFQKAFQMGKFIRSHFSLALNEVTIPKLLFEMSGVHESVLFVGNSEINRQIIAYFKQKGSTDLTLCSRSLYAAQDVGIPLLAWEDLSLWHRYSLVICGSNSPHYVITETQEKVMTEQIFDLSMPRTVDPSIANVPSLQLVNMQELIAILQQRQQCNERAMGEATQAIHERAERFFNQFLLKEDRERLCV
jgi:glutamyl-tRNA reductase